MSQIRSATDNLDGWVRLWEAITEERWPSYPTSAPLYLTAYADWRRDQAASPQALAAQLARQIG